MGFLRFVRGVCGLLAILQIAGIVNAVSWLQNPAGVSDFMWVALIIKVIALAVFGSLFWGVRKLINSIHAKRYGVPHPALAKSAWAL